MLWGRPGLLFISSTDVLAMIQKIARIPLREAFKHEALDFTRWLNENIDVLNDVLDGCASQLNVQQ